MGGYKMQRREFIGTLGCSLAAFDAGGAWAKDAQAVTPGAASNFADIPGVQPGDLDAYFTEEKLKQAIDTSPSLEGINFEVACYNFPSWHSSPYMEGIFGKGWTEYEALKRSRPLYPGHLFPKYPLWGYFNEADPAWAEREIDAAADHGIDVWMIDWYWHSGTMFYHEQLEQGFLKARNRSKLKFAVMWANHHWKNFYPASSPDEAAMLLPQLHSENDTLRVIDYCIEHYFHEPNYWRIDGRPVFAIFDLNLMLETFSKTELKRLFDKLRERVSKAGLGELHIQASHIYGGLERELKNLGIDSATSYHTFGWTYDENKTPGGRSPFGEAAFKTVGGWRDTAAEMSVPYFPDCPAGWDDSPRFAARSHVISERSPDQFERLLRAAQYFSAASPAKPKIIFLSAWNEWTEDHVLLPDTVYGYSYLEAIRRVFRK